MTDEERMQDVKRHQEMFKDNLMPLLSQNGEKGVIAVRIFFAVAHGDGTISGANLGSHIAGREEDALKLRSSVLALLLDLQGNGEVEYREAKPKN